MTQPAQSEFQRLRQVREGQRGIAGGSGIQAGGGAPAQDGNADIIAQAVALDIPEQQARAILASFGGFEKLQAAMSQQLKIQKQQADLQEQPVEPRQFNQTLEDMQVKAIQDGNFDSAIELRNFQKKPTDLQAFNAAVELATSPADIATLSAIARGVFPRQAPSRGNVESLPLSPALQRAGQNLFGAGGLPNADPFTATRTAQNEQQSVPIEPQINPEVPAQQPTQPLPFSQAHIEGAGPIPFDSGSGGRLSQRVPLAEPQPAPGPTRVPTNFAGMDDPDPFLNEIFRKLFPEDSAPQKVSMIPPVDAFSPPSAQSTINDPSLPENRVSAGLTANDVIFPPGSQGANIDPASLSNLTEAQIRFLGGRVINRGRPDTPIAPERPFTPPVDQGPGVTNFGQQPSRNNPFIPEGTPVSQINLNGSPAEVPVGIGELFAGGPIERPKSFLGAVGLPRPSAQAQRNLTAGELDEFNKLAASQGLDPRDVQRELNSGRPSGMPVPRIRSAARR